MSSSIETRRRAKIVAGTACALIPLAIGGFSNRIPHPLDLGAAIFFVFGFAGMTLMGFSWKEIAAGLRSVVGSPGSEQGMWRSLYFWEASARNILCIAVLGSLVGFVVRLTVPGGEMGEIVLSFLRGGWFAFAGLLLSGIFSLMASRLAQQLNHEGGRDLSLSPAVDQPSGSTGISPTHWLGYGLFIAVILFLRPPLGFLTDWHAWLIVLGGVLGVGILLGDPFHGRSLASGFAFAGAAGALGGVIRALKGFAVPDIQTVSGGLGFAISSCFAAMLGLMLLAMPLQDRERGDRLRGIDRLAWYGFPFFVLMIQVIAITMVMIPVTRP